MDKEQAKIIARDIIRSRKTEYGIRTRDTVRNRKQIESR